MGSPSKIIITTVCILSIAVAIGLNIKKHRSGPQPPDWVLDQESTRIDENDPYEVITNTLREWKSLGQEEGKYRNPNTGAYSMVTPMTCGACQEQIPRPQRHRPSRPPAPPGSRLSGPAEMRAQEEAWLEKVMSYKCPKCGELAFDRGDGPPGSRPPLDRRRRSPRPSSRAGD